MADGFVMQLYYIEGGMVLGMVLGDDLGDDLGDGWYWVGDSGRMIRCFA